MYENENIAYPTFFLITKNYDCYISLITRSIDDIQIYVAHRKHIHKVLLTLNQEINIFKMFITNCDHAHVMHGLKKKHSLLIIMHRR